MKVITQGNYRHYKDDNPNVTPERTTEPSQTTPDMTLSIKEIISRHTQGRPIEQHESSYQETEGYDATLANIQSMDKLEKLDEAQRQREKIEVLTTSLLETRAAKAAEKAAKAKELETKKEEKKISLESPEGEAAH